MRTIKLFALGASVLLLLSCSDRPTAPALTKHVVTANECNGFVVWTGNHVDTVWVCQQ